MFQLISLLIWVFWFKIFDYDVLYEIPTTNVPVKTSSKFIDDIDFDILFETPSEFTDDIWK